MHPDDDFDDLLGEIEMFEDSSQEPFTHVNDDDVMLDDLVIDPPNQEVTSSNQCSEDEQLSLCHVRYSNNTSLSLSPVCPVKDTSSDAICQIEGVIGRMIDQMLDDEDEIKITLRSRSGDFKNLQRANYKDIRFPGRSESEAWRFTVVLRILELMHEALRNNVVLSKRDIFYRDPRLFMNQSHVDRYVDDIAYTFNLPRAKLNVTAAAKGLIAGRLTFSRLDGNVMDGSAEREGQLIPPVKDILSVDMSAVRWILVVEKEASFRSILSSGFGDNVMTEGVIITGKGYPDIATRAMLHFLSHPTPRNGFAEPAVLGLADFDPDGIAILAIYKKGSRTMIHENALLCTPMLRWLGLKSQHILLSSEDVHASQGLLRLTRRDRSRARKMLNDDGILLDDQVKNDLQVMLMLNTKAELQLLDAVPDGMSNLLLSQVSSPR